LFTFFLKKKAAPTAAQKNQAAAVPSGWYSKDLHQSEVEI
jgi:hypothetical protein